MAALEFDASDLLDQIVWSTWVAWAMGTVVTALVFGSPIIYRRLRRRRFLTLASREEDVPWDALQGLLEKRSRGRVAAGLPDEEPSLDEVSELLASLPGHLPEQSLEQRQFAAAGGKERRSGGRRWGNPTEVTLGGILTEGRLHGLVVNRSTGGIGIYTDREIPLGAQVHVRAVEAPFYVIGVYTEVRHCRKIGKGFFLGCQFIGDIPWSVRVWFG
jgi:hypothetical protein